MADSLTRANSTPPQIIVVLLGTDRKRAYGRSSLQQLGYARTLQLLRKDFMPELGAASPSFQLQATFHEPGGGSTKDPVPLSQLGWEEMMGGVAVIEIVAIQSPSSGGLWADFGKPMIFGVAKKLG